MALSRTFRCLSTRIVPIPGLGSTKALFAQSLQGLTHKTSRFSIESDAGEAACFSSKTTADAAKKVLALGSTSTPILPIGLSYGGYIALEVLRQALEMRRAGQSPHVTGVVLMDTQCRADPPEALEGRRNMIVAAQKDLAGPVEALLPKFLGASNLERLGKETRQMALSAGAENFCNQVEGIMSRVDTAETLEALGKEWPDLPVLIMCGQEDTLTPEAKHTEMFQLLGPKKDTNKHRFEIIPGCGHFAPWEQPQAVTDVWYDWLVKSGLV